MTRVFLSYTHSDVAFARRVGADLANAGVDVWVDEHEMRAGDDIRRTIEQALEDCDYVLILLSRSALRSPWVQAELSAAFSLRIEAERRQSTRHRVLPALVEECQVPLLLTGVRRVDLHLDYERGIAELLRSVLSVKITTYDLPAPFTATSIRHGDTSSSNRIAFFSVTAPDSQRALFALAESNGDLHEVAVSATALMKPVLVSALTAVLDKKDLRPAAFFEAIFSIADREIRELRVTSGSAYLGAKLTIAYCTSGVMWSAELGDCGGLAVWADEQSRVVSRRLSTTAAHKIELLETDDPPKGMTNVYPIGYLGDNTALSLEPHPLGRHGYFLLTSRQVPKDIGSLVNATIPPHRSLLHDTSTRQAVRGVDYLCVLISAPYPLGSSQVEAIPSLGPGEPGSDENTPEHARRKRARDLRFLAAYSFKERDEETAIHYLARAMVLDPENAEYRMTFGMLLVRYGEYQKAAEHFRVAARSDRSSSTVVTLAATLIEAGEPEEATEVLAAALGDHADDPKVHYWHGCALHKLRRYADAVSSFATAYNICKGDDRIASDSGRIAQWYGSTLVQLKRASEALEPLERAARVAPGNAMNLHWLGVARAIEGIYPQALDALQQSERAQPSYPGNSYWLGVVYHALGRLEEAGAALDSAASSGDATYSAAAREFFNSNM